MLRSVTKFVQETHYQVYIFVYIRQYVAIHESTFMYECGSRRRPNQGKRPRVKSALFYVHKAPDVCILLLH